MTLTIIGIIFSFISPIVAIYLYRENKKFVLELSEANLKNIKQLHSEKVSIEKIDNIISNFLEIYNSSKDTGMSALIKSGIKSINKEHEIKYIITEIHNRTGKNPLGNYSDQMEKAGLLNSFNKIDLPILKTTGGIEKVFEEIGCEKNKHN